MQNKKSTAQILTEILQFHSLGKNCAQEKKLHQKYHKIQKLVQSVFKDKLADKPFQSGSLKKGTAINVKFDLDMVVPFSFQAFSSPKEMYETVGKALQKGGFEPRHQKVSYGIKALKVSDKKIMFVDVVPGLEIQKNFYTNSKDLWLYKRNENSSIKTNLDRQLAHIRSQNDQVRAIIRLMKIWNYHEKNINLKSYMLELLTINAQKNKSTKGLENMLLWNFEYISKHLDLPLKDPGNSTNDSLLSEIKSAAITDYKNRIAKIHKKLEVAFKEENAKEIKGILMKPSPNS